eukprot:TRINITY_DN2689_c0_g1_i4.p1 TRINITY_DN2689_c0_g1~~TRINITY_DN2689_c0_g1_i4.p1  ORF type:complete len:251 (+),score=45.10 TRINITY_DN2689_c0_g1_i4:321-1073(+)
MVQELKIPLRKLTNGFYLLDVHGLLGRPGPKSSRQITLCQMPYVRHDMEDGLSLLETIKQVKPTVLMGLSGRGGLFTEEAIKEMYKHAPRPIVFPMSNPTRNSECTAEQCYTWTEGNAIMASGSPFAPVTVNGKVCTPSQANNMFIFPGLGLAVNSIKAKRISFGMLNRAAIALSQSLVDEELKMGCVYPSIDRIRTVSLHIAFNIASEAFELGLAGIEKPRNLHQFLIDHMWDPVYPDQIYISKENKAH